MRDRSGLKHGFVTVPGTGIVITVLSWLLAGCQAVGRAQTLDGLTGQDVSLAIEALGQPHQVLEQGEGRRVYVWQRIFTYDYGPPSFTLEAWRYESTFWFEEDEQEAPARLCSTRLSVGFDMVIVSWDYGCETITVRREQWPAEQDRPNIIRLPRQDAGNR